MLTVIAILGILAALSVPALKNIGKANIQVSAGRQLIDAVTRARQLAINQHTTVYMVFVSTNFWTPANYNTWWNALSVNQQNEVTNLVDRQLAGYAYLAYGHLGDQPGQHSWHYLSSWQTLPEGNFIAAWKFPPTGVSMNISQWQYDYANYGGRPAITNFNWQFGPFPFPDDAATNAAGTALVPLPCLAFDYTGQLISEYANGAYQDAYIPLAQGTVPYGYDGATKSLQLTPVTGVKEIPAGNSTNISYSIVHVDHATGRCTLEYFKMQ